ncbi:hypothetical protein [Phenylobacterium sp. J367]|uniref:hypothetical protein n=1 Tax=Phenylobacterium sp. J367 TaxID=2898435 RepID=UPI0021509545|nr:hypothetical protein [Phenylobacterium sp. J367]MCR5878430.1 hypothetical protein [Phenylobacterium sp. J367]
MDLRRASRIPASVRFKASEALRFLGGLVVAVLLLSLLVLRVTGCAPNPKVGEVPPPKPGATATAPPATRIQTPAECAEARGWERAAKINGGSLHALPGRRSAGLKPAGRPMPP